MIEQAQEAFGADDFAGAAQLFAQALQRNREDTRAIAGLAKCQIAGGDLDGAATTLALTPGSKENDTDIASARAALELAQRPSDAGEVARLMQAVEHDAGNHQARLDLAVALNAAGRREEALDHLIHIIGKDRTWNDEAARKQLLQFFEAWGMTDELTVAGRRRLSAILFS